MKEEIIAMQPELVATSEETTKIMEKIEIDKVDVDAKKELVQADEAVANKAAMEAKAIKQDFKNVFDKSKKVLDDKMIYLLRFQQKFQDLTGILIMTKDTPRPSGTYHHSRT